MNYLNLLVELGLDYSVELSNDERDKWKASICWMDEYDVPQYIKSDRKDTPEQAIRELYLRVNPIVNFKPSTDAPCLSGCVCSGCVA